MKPLHVLGIGFWTPHHASWSDYVDGRASATPAEPPCSGVPLALLRGTSLITRMSVEVAGQAVHAAGADPKTIASVFGSTLGEIQTAVTLVRSIERGAPPSPIRFKNSVHNTSAAMFGITHENRAFSTSLGATDGLVAMTLLEAWAFAAAHEGPVLISCGEESLPAPLDGFGAYGPLAFACVLSTDKPAHGNASTLLRMRRDASAEPAATPAAFARNAAAPGLPLLSAICGAHASTVALDGGWCVDVDVPGA